MLAKNYIVLYGRFKGVGVYLSLHNGKVPLLSPTNYGRKKPNKCVQPTAHALSICVQLAALPLSHTNGQHMHCD